MHAEVATLESSGRTVADLQRGGSSSVLGEALAYLGGATVLVGSMLIGSWYWDDLTTALRVGVLVGAAVLLLAAGAVMAASPTGSGARLRSVLWLISTGAVAGAAGVLTVDVWATSDADTFLVVAGGTATYATALWWVGRGLVQQVAMVVTVALTVAALINRADISASLPGLGVWFVGVGWAVLGWREHAQPGRVVLALGSVLALVGAMTTATTSAGMVLTLVTVLAIVVTAVALRDLLLLAVGTVGALANIPAAMTRWFPDSVAAAVALVAVGLVLLATAVGVARSPRPRR